MKHQTQKRKVIVIGGSHHNTLGVIRSLGEKGLRNQIILLHDITDKYVHHSRYIKHVNKFTFRSEEEIPLKLITIAKQFSYKPVVICCGDSYIKIINLNESDISKYCIIPYSEIKMGITIYMDKKYQRNLAVECGLRIPHSLMSGSVQNILRTNEETLTTKFPCILKPENSTDGNKSDISICHNINDLINSLSKVDKHKKLIVEEYIDKNAEFQLIGCSLNDTIIIPGYTYIIRQPKTTNTGYLKYSPIDDGYINEELINKAKLFINRIGYKGLFSIEFIRDRIGNDYFLEINMRNDGNSYCVTCAGINLPYIWYKYSPESSYSIEEPIKFNKTIYWMPESDLRNAKNIGIFKWLSEWLCAKGHGVANLKDIAPIIYYTLSKIHLIKKSHNET